MKSSLKRIAAGAVLAAAVGPLLISTGFAAPVAAPSEREDAALVIAVKDALSSAMGKEAEEVVVTAKNGRVTLRGWVNSPKQEYQARMVAAKVPGVKKTYSNMHTWSSKDED